MLGGAARYGGRSLQALSNDLQNVARGLDDARALTWSADLSDTFGRSQTQIRKLLREIDAVADAAGAHKVGSSRGVVVPRIEARAAVEEATNLAGNWPYLAF
jgi:hypothetical protein